MKNSFNEKISERASIFANGSIGRALALAQNFKACENEYESFQKIIKAPWVDRINFCKDFSAVGNMEQTIDNWIMFMRQELIEKPEPRRSRALDRLLKLRYIISHPQYNARLAVENFLLLF